MKHFDHIGHIFGHPPKAQDARKIGILITRAMNLKQLLCKLRTTIVTS